MLYGALRVAGGTTRAMLPSRGYFGFTKAHSVPTAGCTS